uniref:Uncharacterized protein n=1 Tax=Cucumis melo TaxID=3656 RepID=A0A9I9E1Z5_CUCME
MDGRSPIDVMNDARRWLSSKLLSSKRVAIEAAVVEACGRRSYDRRSVQPSKFFSWERAAVEE